uniref:ionotropic receptor 147 n=1 Tax=Aedes aegypti TaxID=7159 RepID=UPI000C292984|nr:ionotropic receptor 147 [Aedes aegypti]
MLSLQVFANVDSILHIKILHQIEKLIIETANEQSGKFECIFINLSSEGDEWTNNLVLSPELRQLARYILRLPHIVNYNDYPRKPSMVVMHVANENEANYPEVMNQVRQFFVMLDCNTRVLVLVNNTASESFQNIKAHLIRLQYDKVAYVVMDKENIVRYDFTGMNRMTSNIVPEVQLFQSMLYNSSRRPIKITSLYSPWEVVAMWILETCNYLRTTYIFEKMCANDMIPAECLRYLYNGNHVDMLADRLRGLNNIPQNFHVINDVQPLSHVIIVPQGRQYTVIEIFTKPFTWKSWTTIMILLFLVEAISAIVPTSIRNDPILLSVCGLERYNLHRASIGEKLIMLFLILFFFVVLNAYETKIISFMINKPSIGQIRTLQELRTSGIKVKADMRGNPDIVNDTLIGSLLIQDNTKPFTSKLDGENAYLMNSMLASFAISLWSNYDFKLLRPKYVVIDERKATAVHMYWFDPRSPYSEIFQYTLKVFFESGLLSKWDEDYYQKFHTADRAKNRHLMEAYFNRSELVAFSDLTWIWIAWSVSLTFSLLTLVAELLVVASKRSRIDSMDRNP